MSDQNAKIAHLNIIQGVVNRLAGNSFFLKGWSITILMALISIWETNDIDISQWNIVIFTTPIILFWGLDAYFLWQERLFRAIYNQVSEVDSNTKIDFCLNVNVHKDKVSLWEFIRVVGTFGHIEYTHTKNFVSSMFSITLVMFYGLQIILVLIYYCVASAIIAI